MQKTILLCLSLCWAARCLAQAPAPSLKPGRWQALLDKNLSHWDTYLSYRHQNGYNGRIPLDERGDTIPPIGYQNHNGVFSVVEMDGDLVLKVTGEYYGCVFTKTSYKNYRLRLKVKWGEKKWEPRLDKLRDAGILYHSTGPCGVDYWRSWMLGQEFQIMEGHFGDYWSIANSAIDIRAFIPEGDMNPVASPGQAYLPLGAGSPNGGFCMRSVDRESPAGGWTSLELLCFEGRSLHIVNGEVVMVLANSRYLENGRALPLIEGKIQLQSEACELFYKDIEIMPIDKLPKRYVALLGQ